MRSGGRSEAFDPELRDPEILANPATAWKFAQRCIDFFENAICDKNVVKTVQ
jgi:hypothetical protein